MNKPTPPTSSPEEELFRQKRAAQEDVDKLDKEVEEADDAVTAAQIAFNDVCNRRYEREQFLNSIKEQLAQALGLNVGTGSVRFEPKGSMLKPGEGVYVVGESEEEIDILTDPLAGHKRRAKRRKELISQGHKSNRTATEKFGGAREGADGSVTFSNNPHDRSGELSND